MKKRILTLGTLVALLSAQYPPCTGSIVEARPDKKLARLYQKQEIRDKKHSLAISPDKRVFHEIKNLKGYLSGRFDKKTIESLFSREELGFEEDIIKSIRKMPSDKNSKQRVRNYEDYRRALRLDEIISRAPEFHLSYSDALSDAELRYGVNKKYITAIHGIETNFAGNVGKYNALNALLTNYVYSNKRKRFNREQIVELIRYSNMTGRDVFEFKSSRSGAIGFSQFMPWSLTHYFIGKKGDIKQTNPYDMEDSIYSVANFLDKKGFKKNKKKSIWHYNQSEWYFMAVKEIAESLDKKIAVR